MGPIWKNPYITTTGTGTITTTSTTSPFIIGGGGGTTVTVPAGTKVYFGHDAKPRPYGTPMQSHQGPHHHKGMAVVDGKVFCFDCDEIDVVGTYWDEVEDE